MKSQTIFLDKVFWSRLYPPLLGCISQAVTTSISLILIWGLSGSVAMVFEADTLRPIIVLSIVLNVLVNGGILVVEGWYTLKVRNLFLIPIDSGLSYRELKAYVRKNQEGGSYAKYGAPVGLIFVNAIFFIVPSILGENWQSALFNSFLAMLPFHIAFLSIHIVKIGLETTLLLLRYIIQGKQ